MMNFAVTIGMMAGATALVLKCQDEAFATPTKEGMCASVRMARQLDTLIGAQRLPISAEVLEEERMLELEVRAMMEKCLEAGDGDIALGVCLGVDYGWVTTMISPWRYNKGNVRLMRDANGAMRYLDTGDMPLPQEVKEYHRMKLAEREKKEGRKADFSMVVSDLQFASRLPQEGPAQAEQA